MKETDVESTSGQSPLEEPQTEDHTLMKLVKGCLHDTREYMWTGKKICWLRWRQLSVPLYFIDVCDSILVALGKIPSEIMFISLLF